MKFLVNTKTLYDQISVAEGVIPKTPMIPILENFLFEINQAQLSVTATDSQITCITRLPIEAKEDGRMAIPARIFLQTLQNLPEEIITISFDESSYNIEIQASVGKYKLSSENPADFPAPQEVENNFSASLSADVLLKAISSSAYSMSTDELRPAMTGLLIKLGPEGITFVGTDGHRLATYIQDSPTHETSHSMIVPRKAISTLEKMLKKHPEETVPIRFNPSLAQFQIANLEMSCRLIDERFPDYEKVIPKDNNNHIILNKEEVLASLRRAVLYANKSTHQIRIQVKGEKCALIVEDLDFSNEADETLSCIHEGEDIEMGFNVRFLMDVFAHIEESQVRLEVSDPNRAALLIPVSASETEHPVQSKALIMPIMLHN